MAVAPTELLELAKNRRPIESVSPPEQNPNSALDSLQQHGTYLLEQQKDRLEHVCHPSGRDATGPIDHALSHGIYDIITNEEGKIVNVFIDFTSHWFTSILDRFKHANLNDPYYLWLLGVLAQEKGTPTENVSWIEMAFVDIMQSFFTKEEVEKDNFVVLPVSTGSLGVTDAIDTAKGLISEKYLLKDRENGLFTNHLKGIAFESGFHGRVDDAAEATANQAKTGHKWQGNVEHVFTPTVEYNLDGSINEELTKRRKQISFEELEKYLVKDEYAYLIVEYPIQAEGGVNIFDKQTLIEISDLCKKYGKLLIVDDVQMGGRTWTVEEDFVSPFAEEVIELADIVTFGKVFHANGSVYNLKNIKEKGLSPKYIKDHALHYGGTHTSDFANMLSGAMIMKTIMEEELWKNALDKTDEIYQAIKNLSSVFPELINTVRKADNTAYMAWSFKDQATRDKFKKFMFDNEYIKLLTAGETSIRFAPPADMDNDEVAGLMGAIERQMVNL